MTNERRLKGFDFELLPQENVGRPGADMTKVKEMIAQMAKRIPYDKFAEKYIPKSSPAEETENK